MALTYRFLFDECLSPGLAELANDLGFQATHVRNLGRLGDDDHTLAAFSVAQDWVFVTNNRADFVRLYRRFDLHPGLVVILPSTEEIEQLGLFEIFIERLGALGDIVNKLIDIHADGLIEVQDWPPLLPNDPNP